DRSVGGTPQSRHVPAELVKPRDPAGWMPAPSFPWCTSPFTIDASHGSPSRDPDHLGRVGVRLSGRPLGSTWHCWGSGGRIRHEVPYLIDHCYHCRSPSPSSLFDYPCPPRCSRSDGVFSSCGLDVVRLESLPDGYRMNAHLFELTIQRGGGGRWPVVAERTAPGAFLPVRAEGFLELDKVSLEVTEPEEYGVILGKALFRGGIRDAFQKAREKGGGGLHVLVCVEDDELRTLRWERLCAPLDGEVWEPLALDQHVPFSIHLNSVTDRPFPPISRNDLR